VDILVGIDTHDDSAIAGIAGQGRPARHGNSLLRAGVVTVPAERASGQDCDEAAVA